MFKVEGETSLTGVSFFSSSPGTSLKRRTADVSTTDSGWIFSFHCTNKMRDAHLSSLSWSSTPLHHRRQTFSSSPSFRGEQVGSRRR